MNADWEYVVTETIISNLNGTLIEYLTHIKNQTIKSSKTGLII